MATSTTSDMKSAVSDMPGAVRDVANSPEMSRLRTDIERLQSGLEAATAKMRELFGSDWLNGHESALATADRMWTGVKRQAQQVGHEIEERPLVSAMTAFGAGVAIGMLFSSGRSLTGRNNH